MATRQDPARPAGGKNMYQVTVKGPVEVYNQDVRPAGPTIASKLPLQTPPAAVAVRLLKVEGERAELLLTVPYEQLVALMDEAFGPMGWCCRRYSCGGTLYTALGLLHPVTGDFAYKDAPAAPVRRDAADPAKAAAAGSLLRAASMWGVCRDVCQLPPLRLKAETVGALPVASADGKTVVGYRLAQPLQVDQFGRDAAGRITHVQFVTGAGVKIVWPEN